MSPVAWRARGMWRRQLATIRKRRAARRSAPKKRRATNRNQLRCGACNLFVRRLCQRIPNPCGVCPRCCLGGHCAKPEDGPR